jgi:hypothetical protein
MVGTDEELQQDILDQTGTGDDSVVVARLPGWWTRNSDASSQGIRLLRTKRMVLQYVVGQRQMMIDTVTGRDQIKASQALGNAERMLAACEAELQRVDPDFVATGPSRAGSVTPTNNWAGASAGCYYDGKGQEYPS